MNNRRRNFRNSIFGLLLLMAGCNESAQQPVGGKAVADLIPSDSVVVVYVHQKKGCITCRAIAEAMLRAEKRVGGSPVAFRDWLINQDAGGAIAATCNLSYAGVVVCRKDSTRLLFTNLTSDAFLLATVRSDSLDRLMDATIGQHLRALQTKND